MGWTRSGRSSRTFLDEGMVRWEAYVSGGQPNTARAARIYFVCLEDPFEPPRWVPHESRRWEASGFGGMSDGNCSTSADGARPGVTARLRRATITAG